MHAWQLIEPICSLRTVLTATSAALRSLRQMRLVLLLFLRLHYTRLAPLLAYMGVDFHVA